ncbi:KLTH0E10384p [Lachancea thermotolerans CBS 6340]|uniref:KLTH0E10384p n=1 Tax=Lachancea thermotolerans (strain ATCC 56472 / CBS 6340 / NRRL Y-8284) TaxID=559295 RepID=C5DI79_LACTC|nr:KLTH0E10384p [Lachancea thermotolerans CBS 6340]CAR23490.1 KLTH0E10384p [Lachancea thermotolerans CBS 6340]
MRKTFNEDECACPPPRASHASRCYRRLPVRTHFVTYAHRRWTHRNCVTCSEGPRARRCTRKDAGLSAALLTTQLPLGATPATRSAAGANGADAGAGTGEASSTGADVLVFLRCLQQALEGPGRLYIIFPDLPKQMESRWKVDGRKEKRATGGTRADGAAAARVEPSPSYRRDASSSVATGRRSGDAMEGKLKPRQTGGQRLGARRETEVQGCGGEQQVTRKSRAQARAGRGRISARGEARAAGRRGVRPRPRDAHVTGECHMTSHMTATIT